MTNDNQGERITAGAQIRRNCEKRSSIQTSRRHGSALVLALGANLFGAGVSSAEGASESAAALTYAGFLQHSDGTPVTEEHDIAIGLKNGDGQRCRTARTPVAPTFGHFAIQLPSDCATVVSLGSDVQVDVSVDDTSLGEARLGAIPFALQAAHATVADQVTALSPEIEARLAQVETRLSQLDQSGSVVCRMVPSTFVVSADPQLEFNSLCRIDNQPSNHACPLVANHYCHENGFAGGWYTAERPAGDFNSVGVCCAGVRSD